MSNFIRHPLCATAGPALLVLVLVAGGCSASRRVTRFTPPDAPPPLGTLSDPIWQAQEFNAEASEFVIYEHEFKLNTTRLNPAGEDHVKQIAVRLRAGQNFPVVVEQSTTSAREDTEHKFPVHHNPELDMNRRVVIVRALGVLGVPDAEGRVVVAPAFARGFKEGEAERAYGQGFNPWSGGFGGSRGFGFSGFGGF